MPQPVQVVIMSSQYAKMVAVCAGSGKHAFENGATFDPNCSVPFELRFALV